MVLRDASASKNRAAKNQDIHSFQTQQWKDIDLTKGHVLKTHLVAGQISLLRGFSVTTDSSLTVSWLRIIWQIFQYGVVAYISKLFCAARFTKIGVPEGRVEGKSRLCNFAIHGNKFRGRWEKIWRRQILFDENHLAISKHCQNFLDGKSLHKAVVNCNVLWKFPSFLRNRSEELFSPTYPGTYPKALDCAYKFIGEPGQRIRLEFRDFDLFYGGAQ